MLIVPLQPRCEDHQGASLSRTKFNKSLRSSNGRSPNPWVSTRLWAWEAYQSPVLFNVSSSFIDLLRNSFSHFESFDPLWFDRLSTHWIQSSSKRTFLKLSVHARMLMLSNIRRWLKFCPSSTMWSQSPIWSLRVSSDFTEIHLIKSASWLWNLFRQQARKSLLWFCQKLRRWLWWR